MGQASNKASLMGWLGEGVAAGPAPPPPVQPGPAPRAGDCTLSEGTSTYGKSFGVTHPSVVCCGCSDFAAPDDLSRVAILAKVGCGTRRRCGGGGSVKPGQRALAAGEARGRALLRTAASLWQGRHGAGCPKPVVAVSVVSRIGRGVRAGM